MTMFIKIENGLPVGDAVTEDNLRSLFPNQLPLIFTPENIEQFGFAIYEWSQIPAVDYPMKNVEITPTLRNGIYYQTWQQVKMNDNERLQATQAQIQRMRYERYVKLINCDWTQLSDVNLDESKRQEWLLYRQNLRDITIQAGFPWDITWPTPPS